MLGNQLLELLTFQGSNPKMQQCLKEEEQCKRALTCHFALDAIYMLHGVVTDRRSNPGENRNRCAWQQAGFSAGTKGEAGDSVGCRAQPLLRPTETPG